MGAKLRKRYTRVRRAFIDFLIGAASWKSGNVGIDPLWIKRFYYYTQSLAYLLILAHALGLKFNYIWTMKRSFFYYAWKYLKQNNKALLESIRNSNTVLYYIIYIRYVINKIITLNKNITN